MAESSTLPVGGRGAKVEHATGPQVRLVTPGMRGILWLGALLVFLAGVYGWIVSGRYAKDELRT